MGRSVCLREKARSWRTSAAARLAFWRICIRSPCSTSATSWRISSRSQWPLIAVSRLLKSCATPPASWPTACIFWLCTNCASRVLSSVASERTASSDGRAVEHGAGEGDLQEDLLAVARSPRAISERPRARPLAVSASRSAIGRPRPSISSAMLAPGRARVAEELAGGLVGVGEPAVGLEAGQRHRQLLEEVVGHEAGDLGAVQRHQQQVAPAVGARGAATARTAWPVAASTCTPSGRSGGSARTASRSGRPAPSAAAAAFGSSDAAVGVDAEPGDAGVREARGAAPAAAAARSSRQSSVRGAGAGDHDAVPLRSGLLDRDAVQARLAGQPVARRRRSARPLERAGAAGGGVGARGRGRRGR